MLNNHKKSQFLSKDHSTKLRLFSTNSSQNNLINVNDTKTLTLHVLSTPINKTPRVTPFQFWYLNSNDSSYKSLKSQYSLIIINQNRKCKISRSTPATLHLWGTSATQQTRNQETPSRLPTEKLNLAIIPPQEKLWDTKMEDYNRVLNKTLLQWDFSSEEKNSQNY